MLVGEWMSGEDFFFFFAIGFQCAYRDSIAGFYLADREGVAAREYRGRVLGPS